MQDHSQDYGHNQQQWIQFVRYVFILYTYIANPLIIVGLVGNIIAFYILGKIVHQNAITFLLRALAVVDSCLLSNAAFLSFVRLSPPYFAAIQKFMPYYSVYIMPIVSIGFLINSWTTVLIGMNRYIAMCRPLQAPSLCTTSRARKYLICVVLASIACGIPGFLMKKIGKTAKGSIEIVPRWPNNKLYADIGFGCIAVITFLIPFCMLLFFCVRIIITLRASRSRQLGRIGGQQVDRKVTSMVLVLLGIFLVCQLYSWIVTLLSHIPVDIFPRHMGFFYAEPIMDVLFIFNSSVNCLIYLVYMKEFRRLLCGKGTHRSPQNQDYELT